MMNLKEDIMNYMETLYVLNQSYALKDVTPNEEINEDTLEDLHWLFEYNEKKFKFAAEQLVKSLSFVLLAGEKIQMEELGYTLDKINQETVDMKEVTKYLEEILTSHCFVIPVKPCMTAKGVDTRGYSEFLKQFNKIVNENATCEDIYPQELLRYGCLE